MTIGKIDATLILVRITFESSSKTNLYNHRREIWPNPDEISGFVGKSIQEEFGTGSKLKIRKSNVLISEEGCLDVVIQILMDSIQHIPEDVLQDLAKRYLVESSKIITYSMAKNSTIIRKILCRVLKSRLLQEFSL